MQNGQVGETFIRGPHECRWALVGRTMCASIHKNSFSSCVFEVVQSVVHKLRILLSPMLYSFCDFSDTRGVCEGVMRDFRYWGVIVVDVQLESIGRRFLQVVIMLA